MNSLRIGGMAFLFVLCAFAGLLTQHRAWTAAAVVASVVVGRELGLRSRESQRPR